MIPGVVAGAAVSRNLGNVISLLHFDNGLFDEAGRNWVATGCSVVNAESKFGQGALYCPNVGSIRQIRCSDANLPTLQDFTVELWLKPLKTSGLQSLFMVGTLSSPSIHIYQNGAGISASHSNTSIGEAVGSVAINNYHHVSFCRQGSLFRLFVDGVQVASRTSSNAPITFTNGFGIGCDTSDFPLYGRIDEFLLTTGLALRTSNFVPPSSPY